jgi:WASH complex subunit 7
MQQLNVHDAGLGMLASRIFTMFSKWQSVCQTDVLLGLRVAYFLRSVICKTFDLHSAFEQCAIQSDNIAHLGRMIELLKAIQLTFFLNQSAISHNLPPETDRVLAVLRRQIDTTTRTMRKRQYKRFRTEATNIGTLLAHCLQFFSSEFSTPCMEVISDLFSSKAFTGLGFARHEVWPLLRSLKFLQHYHEHIDRACGLSFLIDQRELFENFLKATIPEPRRIVYLSQAMNDVADTVRHNPELYEKVDNLFHGLLRKQFMDTFLKEIETELRFHTHAHLQVSERNPFRRQYLSFEKFLSVPPFKLVTRFVDFRFEASYHFTRVFYNEVAVAPQVWETYAEMANVARRLYGIEVLDCHIPGAMMAQDVDVLEIMRQISRFVACHNYDLNSQVFVQRAEDSHHISIVGIPHIFSSYRCHGIGIMNTTVDFTYRFLKTKFNVFSKFLFDDNVKSHLVNDIGWFEQHKEECGGLWPYQRAEKLVVDMKRMGQDPQGASVLDHFRVLITEIGNSLGFVRMVRSGGARFLNNAIGFVYDEDEALSFHEFAEEVQLPQATLDATSRLDSVVSKLKELFNSRDSFFKLLVDVFAGPFRDKKNSHLHNFYAIVPALTLSYLDHIAQLKDNAQKLNKNASFSDDGFPMGLAYILKLLAQDALFDSIHWFGSLKQRAEEEKREALNTTKKNPAWGFQKGDNKQTLKLSLQMIARRIREYELLETTVHSARILFN